MPARRSDVCRHVRWRIPDMVVAPFAHALYQPSSWCSGPRPSTRKAMRYVCRRQCICAHALTATCCSPACLLACLPAYLLLASAPRTDLRRCFCTSHLPLPPPSSIAHCPTPPHDSHHHLPFHPDSAHLTPFQGHLWRALLASYLVKAGEGGGGRQQRDAAEGGSGVRAKRLSFNPGQLTWKNMVVEVNTWGSGSYKIPATADASHICAPNALRAQRL